MPAPRAGIESSNYKKSRYSDICPENGILKKLLYTEAPHSILLSRLPDSQIFTYFLLLTDLCNGITENKLPVHSGRNRSGLSPDFLWQFRIRNCSLNILLFNYKEILSLFYSHFNSLFAAFYFNFSRDINRKLISRSPQDIQII